MPLFERSEPKRVVVTGIGMITPQGKNTEIAFSEMKNGTQHIRELSFFHDVIRYGAEITDFDPKIDLQGKIEPKKIRNLPIAGWYAMQAVDEALAQAGLLSAENAVNRVKLSTEIGDGGVYPHEVGAYIGTGIGGAQDNREPHPKANAKPKSELHMLHELPERTVTPIMMHHRLTGDAVTHVAACESGLKSIIDASARIASGNFPEKIMIAGGTEAALHPHILDNFHKVQALATPPNADGISYPMDQKRSGFHMGEGAGILVLEELEHALMRGATPLAEVIGIGNGTDGGASDVAPTGVGLEQAMRRSLRTVPDFGHAGDIYIIKTHTTATGIGDEVEVDTIQKVFPDADQIVAHAEKSQIGHACGASGAIASVGAIAGLMEGVVPGSTYHELMPEVNFHVPERTTSVDARFAMVNSSGFGGLNGVIIFEKFRG